MKITSLSELAELLEILKSKGVAQFAMDDLKVVFEDDMVESEEDVDERTPTSAMGFETTSYASLGITTEFDE